ncbi:GNAT family N-acetyltransferase [Nocardiopsis xinjiangensis]|uniref:GNAT family N-acetyltransferase n=1 Tax=Nocardiopsis xinjiangensis TaxID=124285 RepID=UPI000382C68F|nr:GNAT family N-acetyltransferase [Nocardiopsis xinjiangensis]
MPTPETAGPWTVRGIDRDELPDVAEVVLAAMIAPELPEEVGARLRHFPERNGYGRILAAVDEHGAIVGSTRSHAFDMALPGGVRRVAGVTGVGVWPTRRRQGVLSALMRRQLADLRSTGEHYAALWASESGIYGRYGFGLAVTEVQGAIDLHHAGLRADAPRDPGLWVELERPEAARAPVEEVFGRVARTQLGRFARDQAWWDRLLKDDPAERGGKGPLRVSVVQGADGPVGYALHRAERRWSVHGSRSVLHVQEAVALTPAAHTALYEHLFSFDLITRVEFDWLAQDDPLEHLVLDHQSLETTLVDSLWVRLVDVPAALSERTYAVPFEAVLEVTDRYAPWNAGTWHVKGGPDGAQVDTTEAAPDVSLDVSHLGAAHLGQRPLLGPLRAGLISEHTPGTVTRLDTALSRSDPAICGLIF